MNRAHFTITTQYIWAASAHKNFKIFFVEDRYDRDFRDHVERIHFWKVFFYWCRDQYGEPGVRWGFLNSGDYRNYICFMDETDACSFKLRWC